LQSLIAFVIESNLKLGTLDGVSALYSDESPVSQDSPSPIGHQATISAPHMHAHALEQVIGAIEGVDAPRILDVGCGSGYLTACFGRLIQDKPQGKVMFQLLRRLSHIGSSVEGQDARTWAISQCGLVTPMLNFVMWIRD